ncbi:MAG: bis-aminopropyl spermidine synthase family protein [Brockia lithotrophica]|nr:bis-aminopropyl spermidine synthase family protein [Brockia lithotrophica]
MAELLASTFFLFLFLAVIFLLMGLRIVSEYDRLVVFRLGRYVGERGPGIVYIVPFIERAEKVDTRVITLEVPTQETLTRDNIPTDKELYREFLRVSAGRPPAIQDFDQGSVTPETTVSRVLFLEQNGDLWGKDILVLGAEDDLTGLAIALTRKARRVLVLDIDARLVDFDNRAFRELGIDNAEARVFDLRNPLPEELLGAFDVFVSDPPETLASFRAFIGRGIAALREEGAVGYFGLTLRDASVYKWREFQRLLTGEFGVVITDILQNFNHYTNWDYHPRTRAAQIAPVAHPPRDIWYRSAWYRIEVLPGFVRWNEPIDDDVFYLDEEGTTT